MPRKIEITKEKEQELVDYYLAGNSIVSCMNHFNFTQGLVERIIIRERKIGRPHKLYTVDDNYFSLIDTPDKAYFLGWIVSDGSIVSNTKTELSIQEGDVEAIDKLIKYTKFTGKKFLRNYSAKGWQNQYRVGIFSKQWVSDFNKLGITRNKTCTTIFPDIPEELWSHFIRGFFDGDGCIIVRKDNYNALYFSMIGNRPLIERIQEILIQKCDLNKTKLIHSKHELENIVSLVYYGTPQCLRIANWLYKDCSELFLTRKYRKFYEK